MSDAAATYTERLRWFHEARFGLFIHWGPYSVLGQGEWVMFNQRIPLKEYARLARRFTAKKFDADAWAAMAVEAGMKYAVLTARHHDGFCLYDSAVSDFTSVKIGAKRDLLAEYVSACRRAGLKVGIYYSLLDWRFPGNFEPAKLPESSQAMVEQAHAQMRELMTNYGTVDLVWYDGGYVYNGMTQPRRHGAVLESGRDQRHGAPTAARHHHQQPHRARRGHRHARAAREGLRARARVGILHDHARFGLGFRAQLPGHADRAPAPGAPRDGRGGGGQLPPERRAEGRRHRPQGGAGTSLPPSGGG